MDENNTATATPGTNAAPGTVQPPATQAPPTQAEIEAKAAKEKAEAEAAAAEQYIANRKKAELGCMTSQIEYNNAATYAAWGIGIGAVLAGTGILIYSLKS